MSVAPEHDAVSSILRRGAVPELFVFDLDMTIWRAHVDCTTGAPFRRQERDTAIACGGERICMFRDSRKILDGLKSAGARMAAASRTTTPDDARDLLATLDMVTYFESESLMQIFPAGKQAHFKRLHEASGVDYSKMIFFDDEPWNVSVPPPSRLFPVRNPISFVVWSVVNTRS